MKITIDIECSPKEARAFLGLPDVEPLQDVFMARMKEKISSGLSSEDMDKLFKLWLAPGFRMAGQNMEDRLEKNMAAFQNIFWNAAKSSEDE